MTWPAVFSLGSNLGDRLGRLQLGVDTLAERCGAVRVSPVYESVPQGMLGSELFLNAVCLTAVVGPRLALDAALAAEHRAGRERVERWAPRSLDVDVIAVDELVSDEPALTLPHPRARLRPFVLAPWLDVDPQARIAGAGRAADLLAQLDVRGIRRRDDLTLRST
ncbi:MAG TPA: 2-amino-4-hydroxy-6-hydroxymethyldihydropteridine diphosphokinase [Mycobacteriales bacterium]|nr:2-amino-4-hydroxy-6-hydroxymethyldihydropteridine diphosphokinase [Mycobacteriales bacterium]